MAFHQSETCFRRYEHVIAQALERYPEPVRFKSKARSVTTDSARCSDAIAAYKRNRWPVSSSFFDLIEERDLRVWVEKDLCVIGPNLKKAEEAVVIVAGVGDGLHGAMQCFPKSNENVKTLIHLINDGVITTPIEIDKIWHSVAETETLGLLNIAIRVEQHTIILF